MSDRALPSPTVVTPSGLVVCLQWAGRALIAQPRAVRIALALAWAGFIWFVSSVQSPSVGDVPLPSVMGNFAHAPVFGLLSLFTVASLAPQAASATSLDWPNFQVKHFVWAVALVVGYGLIDEVHQSFTPGRVPSVGDILTDGLGATAVAVTIHRLHPLRRNGRGLLWFWAIALCVLFLSAACADNLGLPGFEGTPGAGAN